MILFIDRYIKIKEIIARLPTVNYQELIKNKNPRI